MYTGPIDYDIIHGTCQQPCLPFKLYKKQKHNEYQTFSSGYFQFDDFAKI